MALEQDPGGYVTTPDGAIHYLKIGSGYPLLLFHPLNTSTWVWHMVTSSLARYFTCYALDMLGHGKSDKPSRDFTLPDFSTAIDNAMEQLGIPSAHVMGNSVGALLAVELAASYPDRVQRLVLIGAPVWDPRDAQRILDGDTNYDDSGYPMPRSLQELKTDGQFVNPYPEWVDKYNELRSQAGIWVRKTMEALAWYDLVSRLHHIRQKATLIVYGERDQLRKDEDLLLYNLPRASKVVLPNQGHIPQIDGPQAFLSAVIPFLTVK